MMMELSIPSKVGVELWIFAPYLMKLIVDKNQKKISYAKLHNGSKERERQKRNVIEKINELQRNWNTHNKLATCIIS